MITEKELKKKNKSILIIFLNVQYFLVLSL